MATKPIPEGYHTLTPYLVVKDGARAIDFYKRAFGAQERFRMPGPDGRIGHAELQIGDSIVMLADEAPEHGAYSPDSLKGTPVTFVFYVNDVDSAYKRAVDAGARVHEPLENKFYGDRMGSVTDPFGHTWHLATHIEDVSPEEMQRRGAELAARSN